MTKEEKKQIFKNCENENSLEERQTQKQEGAMEAKQSVLVKTLGEKL